MKSSQAKKASITLPAAIDSRLRKIAKREHRSLSGVIQEATRYYLMMREWEEHQRESAPLAVELALESDDDIDSLLHQKKGATKYTEGQ